MSRASKSIHLCGTFDCSLSAVLASIIWAIAGLVGLLIFPGRANSSGQRGKVKSAVSRSAEGVIRRARFALSKWSYQALKGKPSKTN